jgi:2-polyprenyl-3-methyl-5-hydroxy-6-metoxy-1,4-benzoquinol methylase
MTVPPMRSADLEVADCPLCGPAASTPLLDDVPDRLHGLEGRYRVVRCDSCGLARTDPRPTPESIGAFYPGDYVPFHVGDDRDRGVVGFLRRVTQAPYRRRYGSPDLVFPPESPTAVKLLDVGAGSGAYAARMRAAGWDVWALEPGPTAAEMARKKLGDDRVLNIGLLDAEYPDEFFDAITMAHVLEHIHDPIGGLARIRRWLRPNGRLQVSVPNLDSLDRKLFRSYWLGYDLPRHLYHFSPDTARAVIERAGFAVESVTPQFIPSVFGQSLGLAINGIRRRPGYGRAGYYAGYPFGAVLAAFGKSTGMTVTARR